MSRCFSRKSEQGRALRGPLWVRWRDVTLRQTSPTVSIDLIEELKVQSKIPSFVISEFSRAMITSAEKENVQRKLKPVQGKPCSPQRVVKRGEIPTEIGGKRFYHPNIERVIVEVATSPYQTSKHRRGVGIQISQSQFSHIPPKILRRFLEAATYDISKARARYREHIPSVRPFSASKYPPSTPISSRLSSPLFVGEKTVRETDHDLVKRISQSALGSHSTRVARSKLPVHGTVVDRTYPNPEGRLMSKLRHENTVHPQRFY